MRGGHGGRRRLCGAWREAAVAVAARAARPQRVGAGGLNAAPRSETTHQVMHKVYTVRKASLLDARGRGDGGRVGRSVPV